jgi:hypothetical protein
LSATNAKQHPIEIATNNSLKVMFTMTSRYLYIGYATQ